MNARFHLICTLLLSQFTISHNIRYSFSIILWEIFTEEEPFPTYFTSDTFFRDIIEGYYVVCPATVNILDENGLIFPPSLLTNMPKIKLIQVLLYQCVLLLFILCDLAGDDLAPRRPKISQILTTLEEIKEEAQKRANK